MEYEVGNMVKIDTVLLAEMQRGESKILHFGWPPTGFDLKQIKDKIFTIISKDVWSILPTIRYVYGFSEGSLRGSYFDPVLFLPPKRKSIKVKDLL